MNRYVGVTLGLPHYMARVQKIVVDAAVCAHLAARHQAKPTYLTIALFVCVCVVCIYTTSRWIAQACIHRN